MSKELLTEILEAVQDCHNFLTSDLQREQLAAEVEGRRQQLAVTTSDVIAKIRSSHVSVRPRLYTPTASGKSPAVGKKPAPKPPAVAPPPLEANEGGQEMYVECDKQDQHQPEDYLTFTHSSQNGDSPQEMYEAMNNTDEPQDVYEEPVQGVLTPPPRAPSSSPHPPPTQPPPPPLSQEEDIQQDVYEEPILFPPHSGPTPTPPASAENSGSGAVYARANIQAPPSGAAASETATEWIYSLSPRKDEKAKVNQLENVTCKGNLEKLGGKNKKTWQIRYCVLSGPFMYFFEKESSKTYRNCISLPMYTSDEAPELTNAKKRHFAFRLTHTDPSGKKKDYYFRSTKKESCDKWLQAIRSVHERTVNRDSQHVAMTLPRVTPQASSSSVAAASQPDPSVVDIQQEMYEPIEPIGEVTLSEEEMEAQEEYVDVKPAEELEQEEYVAVDPAQLEQEEYVAVDPSQLEDIPQEEYEDASLLQFRPSPVPAPSPHAPPSPHIPSHRPDPPVDVTKIYQVAPNGIDLQKVYVALWDFAGLEGDELSVQRGDLVHVADPDPTAEWWAGEGLDADATAKTGSFGFLPATYFTAAFEEVA